MESTMLQGLKEIYGEFDILDISLVFDGKKVLVKDVILEIEKQSDIGLFYEKRLYKMILRFLMDFGLNE